jgi:hypothetical protein
MVCSELALDLAQPNVAERWTMEDDQAGARGEWTEVGVGDDDGGGGAASREQSETGRVTGWPGSAASRVLCDAKPDYEERMLLVPAVLWLRV